MLNPTTVMVAKGILLPILLFSAAIMCVAQVKITPPPPVVIGSGSGNYTYTPGQSRDEKTVIKLKAEGFLLGEVVVNFTIGTACGGSVAFLKENGSVFSGAYFVDKGKTAEIRDHFGQFKRIITKDSVVFEINLAVEFGGMRFMAEKCSNSFSYSARIENYHRYIQPKPYPGKLGSTDYYDFRHKECLSRHPGIGAPAYYKAFGEKYFNKFTTEVFPKLSSSGQEFLARVGVKLQGAIEDKLKAEPVQFAYLELNGQSFTKFAFETHPPAYCSSGWGKLDEKDRKTILSAVELVDLLADKYDRISFGRAWIGIVTAGQVQACVGYKIPM